MAHRYVADGDEPASGGAAIASFVVDRVQGCSVVACSGEIDVWTMSAFREALQDAERSSRRVIVDLSEDAFLDSTGVGAILRVVRATGDDSRGGALYLVGPSGVV